MKTSIVLLTVLLAVGGLPGCNRVDPVLEVDYNGSGEADLRDQVDAVERAFAQSMANRDHEAFATFLSEETIFISGPTVLRGKQQVADQWKVYFDGPEAPFSWEPETVEVLDSGTLALTTGPVHNAGGTFISTFTSIWRQEAPGVWRIVLDRGGQICPPRPCS